MKPVLRNEIQESMKMESEEDRKPSPEPINSKMKKRPPKGNILFVTNISPLLNYEQIKKGLF